ncbi:DUF2937 family protein [Mesobaculum littorinae]|uniref:DUF2937 family protein n=1 Tax=Mesobaculum littorinae TaxID=2486419 RepID=A0A438AL12_9RHOB|nr:DUF2937 family protein [Mesobaculum littorinae]RVV99359.1 DUF2937 family protein [Mesobaculum littorinae]
MIRTLSYVGGFAGAVALSQFPEFSQQYLQRLSGALNELHVVVESFDTTAAAAGLDRDSALAELGGNAVSDEMRGTMSRAITRYDTLQEDYAHLVGAQPLERLVKPWYFSDGELIDDTLEDFRPAMPVTVEGLIFAGIGFVGGWIIIAFVLSGLRRILFGRRDYA